MRGLRLPLPRESNQKPQPSKTEDWFTRLILQYRYQVRRVYSGVVLKVQQEILARYAESKAFSTPTLDASHRLPVLFFSFLRLEAWHSHNENRAALYFGTDLSGAFGSRESLRCKPTRRHPLRIQESRFGFPQVLLCGFWLRQGARVGRGCALSVQISYRYGDKSSSAAGRRER